MAVISITEQGPARGGTVERNWVRTYTRTFQVLTDDRYDSTLTIRAALPVDIGDVYRTYESETGLPDSPLREEDTGSFCSRIAIRCISDDFLQWEAVCDYSPFDSNQTPANPIDWPIRISWGNATYQLAADRDRNGDPILNTAGLRFEPPLVVDGNRPILRIVRNEPFFDPAIAAQFSDAVNEFAFFGEDPKTWKCKPILAELEFNRDCGTADGYYYVVTYEFEYNRETWVQHVLEQGLRELDSSGNRVPITENGLPVTEPVPLDADGHKLAASGTPIYTDWEVYPLVDFALLNLDPAGAPGQGWL